MSESTSPNVSPPPNINDDAVLQYLAAIEAGRAAPPDFPEPDRIASDLGAGDMMKPEDEGVGRQLREYAPGTAANVERLEEGFVAGAKDYGRRNGIRYNGWIEAGVDPAVLDRAGITPDSD